MLEKEKENLTESEHPQQNVGRSGRKRKMSKKLDFTNLNTSSEENDCLPPLPKINCYISKSVQEQEQQQDHISSCSSASSFNSQSSTGNYSTINFR